jgi:hypothetical protein
MAKQENPFFPLPQSPRVLSFIVALSFFFFFSFFPSSHFQQICSICLTKMKQGGGQAIFTAECSYSFHFHCICIASSVKHGNQICPVCRAKWKEILVQGPSLDPPPRRASISPVGWPQNDALMTVVCRLPPTRRDSNRRHIMPLYQAAEGINQSSGLPPK